MIIQVDIDELYAAGIEPLQLEKFIELNEINSIEELERVLLTLIEINYELRYTLPS